MRRKTAGRVAKPRKCALCGGLMMASRPVVLLQIVGGAIVGPYHSGCAEKIVLQASQGNEVPLNPGYTNYGTVLSAREETLPW